MSVNVTRKLSTCLKYGLAGLILTVSLIAFFDAYSVLAQDDSAWRSPQMITGTDGLLASSSVALLADGYGNLHLFYPNRAKGADEMTINYTLWNGNRWLPSVDIFAGSSILYPHVTLDSKGIVHMIWRGSGRLRYASAPLSEAGSANAWTKPLTIGQVVGESGIAIGPGGELYVIYANPDFPGVEIVSSLDGGRVWSNPSRVATVSQDNVIPDGVQIAVDKNGRLHVTWTEWELPSGSRSVGVFYTHSTDGGETWAAPLKMAEGHFGQINVGIRGPAEVHLVWRSGVGGEGTFHQWSADGGDTWAEVEQFADGGGFSGLPFFAEDAAGVLHYVIGSVKYAFWDGQKLSDYVDVAAEQRKIQTRSVERGNIAITSGNEVHVVYELDFQSLWHTSKLLDMAALPTKEAPEPIEGPGAFVEGEAAENSEIAMVPTGTPPTVAQLPEELTQRDENSSFTPLVIGALSGLALVVLIVGINLTVRKGR